MRSNIRLVSGFAFLVVAALHGGAFAQKGQGYHDAKTYTTDLNHPGWVDAPGTSNENSQVLWVPITAACPSCKFLADVLWRARLALIHLIGG